MALIAQTIGHFLCQNRSIGTIDLEAFDPYESVNVMARDFMEPHNLAHPDDYFGNCYLSQEQPDFTVRNINDLVSHSNPVPRNLYSLIRGRDIFDQVESYKAFLEDVRQ